MIYINQKKFQLSIGIIWKLPEQGEDRLHLVKNFISHMYKMVVYHTKQIIQNYKKIHSCPFSLILGDQFCQNCTDVIVPFCQIVIMYSLIQSSDISYTNTYFVIMIWSLQAQSIYRILHLDTYPLLINAVRVNLFPIYNITGNI